MVGLLGSGHCLGMCGGLVSAFFMKVGAGGRRRWPYAHLSRRAHRRVCGRRPARRAARRGAGLHRRLGLAQGVLQIVAGALVILLGLDLLGLSPIRNAWGFAPLAWLRRQFMTATQKGPIVGA